MTSTALKSNPRMKDALAVRLLSEKAQVVRAVLESDPKLYGGTQTKMERLDRAIFSRHLEQARDLIDDLDQVIAAKQEAAAIHAGAQEREALAETRGAPTVKTETGVATRDGWLWLVNKGRYSPGRVEAGRLFREKFSKATDDSMKSCLNDSGGGGAGDGNPMAARLHAQFEIDGVRSHMRSAVGLLAGATLFDLLTAVCGRGETVRQIAAGDDRKADAKAIELGFALDLAGVYLGAVRT